mmetsp:Transcript_28316/g.74928  ORF Transcript_28316/g.74928 Transcript_28316/m.74928 type:complete len:112 (+) Transcript_28316:90-425(+)
MASTRRSPLARALVLAIAASALLLLAGPAFVPGAAPTQIEQVRGDFSGFAAPAAAAAIASMPMAAYAAGPPTPVVGILIMSVIVVLVLLITFIVGGRGLNDAFGEGQDADL